MEYRGTPLRGTEKQGKPELNTDMVRDCWDGFADGHLDGETCWCTALVQPLSGKPGSVVGNGSRKSSTPTVVFLLATLEYLELHLRKIHS